MNKLDEQIVAWLEEKTDFEEASAQNLLEDVSESDRGSEHSDHNTDTEQSAAESDKEVPSTPQSLSVLAATPSQKSSRAGRGRRATVSQIPSRRRIRRSTVTQESRSPSPVNMSQRQSRRLQRQCTTTKRSCSRSPISVTSQRPSRSRQSSQTRSPTRSSSDEPLVHLIDRPRTSAATTVVANLDSRPARVPIYKGKDGTKWLVRPPSRPNIRTRQENIVINPPGVQGEAKNSKTPLECFNLFITKQMLKDIVLFTNINIRAHNDKFSRERDTKETDLTEIEALVGILVMAGLKKMNHLNIHEMWIDDGTAPDIFRAVMSKTRFFFLLRNVRFDDVQTRTIRVETDNMAAMRDIFETFVTNCQTHYQIGENGTIDEMLESFRGRCKFRVYMANKPAKYGIKIYALVDSKSFYTSNLEVYAGKQPAGQFSFDNSPSPLVKRLSNNILNTGRNITMDNYFTSIPLADELVANHRTTVVGTLRKNKRQIPPCFLVTKDRDKPSTMFGFGEKKVLISYVPNKQQKKVVLLLSTLHDDNKIDGATGAAKKPEIITYYNGTKGGVDVVDQMKEEYSVGRMTRRWPMRLFFSVLNIAGINSQIIYKENTHHHLLRRFFLKEIALALTKPHIIRRSEVNTLQKQLRNQIVRFVPPEQQHVPSGREGICAVCPSKKNRRTKKGCNRCAKLLCNEHCMFMCQDCFAEVHIVDTENV